MDEIIGTVVQYIAYADYYYICDQCQLHLAVKHNPYDSVSRYLQNFRIFLLNKIASVPIKYNFLCYNNLKSCLRFCIDI